VSNRTPCIRCGKLRIVAKSWSERVSGSLITYTQTICPDPDCQKIVDRELQEKINKIAIIQRKSLKRRKSIIRTRKAKSKK
jgi:hypothetical protein